MQSSKPVEFLPGRAGERALVARLAAGDDVAFRELYVVHAPRLLRVLLRMLRGDRMLAEEVLQESFVAAFQSIGNYRHEAALSTWLMSIVVRRGLNAIRGESRRAAATSGLTSGDDLQPSVGARDAVRRVLELIDQLEEPKRLTMLLVAEGLAPAEIAEMTGEERGAVATRICRTRAQLAKQAADEGLIDVASSRGGR